MAISAAGVFGAWRLPPYDLTAGSVVCALAALLFYYADHRRWVRDPAGNIVADRWQIVLTFAGFRWTCDKANRHFFFSGDTGSGKTSDMNGLLAALFRRNPTVGGVTKVTSGFTSNGSPRNTAAPTTSSVFARVWSAKPGNRSTDSQSSATRACRTRPSCIIVVRAVEVAPKG